MEEEPIRDEIDAEEAWNELEEQIERDVARSNFTLGEAIQYTEAMRLAHALATKRGILVDAQTLLEEMGMLCIEFCEGYDAGDASMAKGMATVEEIVKRAKRDLGQ